MGQLNSDKNFSQVVRKIRDALIIPTYNLSSFHGYEDSFGIFNKTNSSGNPSFSPYDNKSKIKLETIEQVKDHYPEAVNWTNWRNLSFIQTFYNFQHNNNSPVDGTFLERNYDLDKYMEFPFYASHRPRLPLSVQGVSNDTLAQLDDTFDDTNFDLQWLDKNEWESMLETYTDVPAEAHEYFLFFPYAETDTFSHNIHYTNKLFAIVCLTWNEERTDWNAQSWEFQTPISDYLEEWNPQKTWTTTNRFFGGNSFPLTDFRHQAEYGDDTSGYWGESKMQPFAWNNGEGWGVEGGGFYLGQDAKPFLDLFQKTKPEPKGFGLFNWWW